MQDNNPDNKFTRQDIQQARQTLQKMMEGLIDSSLHPYQGEWLTTDDYQQRNETDSCNARVHFREIIALNIVITLLSVFLLLLVWLMCY